MKKKLFVILLSLVMVVTMMPLSVFADTANTSDKEAVAEETNATADEVESDVVDPSTDYLSFTAVDGDTELSMEQLGALGECPTYEYSADKSSWTEFFPKKTKINLVKDQTIYFRAKIDGQDFPGNEWNYLKFVIKKSVAVGGNIMSLISKDCSKTEMKEHGFDRLFSGCSIVTAPKLPAKKLADHCYFRTFEYCSRLKSPPVISAECLEDYCCAYMFDGCLTLKNAPKLSAEQLANNCYLGMFFNCENLEMPAELPANTLAEDCYNSMFMDCCNLKKSPKLSAQILKQGCYASMFSGCTSLVNPPELPATKLEVSCYGSMFEDCTSLTEAPNLPAKHLTQGCYSNMFYGCTNLTTAPYLVAEKFEDGCYHRMFEGCSKLNNVKVGLTSWLWPEEAWRSPAENWLEGVAPNGTFTCPTELDTSIRDASHIPAGWMIKHPDPSTDYLSFTAVGGDVNLSMKKEGEAPDVTYEYSSDKSTWKDFTPGVTTVNIAKDNTIYFRAKVDGQNFPGSISVTESLKFTMTGDGKINAGGNIMSLVSKDCSAVEMGVFGFNSLFYGCSKLKTPPKLSATILASSCYESMFKDCTSLDTAPDLPATTLVGSCYDDMFDGCISLTTAPNLPAKTLVFGCYSRMFKGCSKLNNITVEFTEWLDGGWDTDNWLSGVAAKGTFTCPAELDTSVRDDGHVPAGWTVVKPTPPTPPDIPTMKSLKAKAVDSKTCQLNWDRLTQFDNVKYEIYRGTTPTGQWPKIATVSSNSYTDKNVKSGTKYYYMLRPVVTVDGKDYYGPYSNKDYGYPRINALTGFSVWASDYKTANISWNKCLDKDAEFWIYRGTKPTGDWGPVYAKVTENEATSWSETLAPGSKYYYMVREAVKGNDGKYYFGPYTKVDYAYPRLNAPSGFSAWASDKTTCKCSWTKLPGDGIQYLVYRGNAPTGNWGPAIGTTTDGSYTDKGRTTGHKYYYMVRAKVTVNGKTYFGPYTKVDYGYPR